MHTAFHIPLRLINPRCACAARVTVVTLSVCLFHQYLTGWTSRSESEDIDIHYMCRSRDKIICLV